MSEIGPSILVALTTRIRSWRVLFAPAFGPALIGGMTVLSLFLLHRWSAQPNAADRIQSELNEQHDRFSRELARTTELMVEMQRRTARAEQSRDELKKLMEGSQNELRANQRELVKTQAALLRAETALKRYEEERARVGKGASKSGGEKSISSVRPAAPADPKRAADLANLEKECGVVLKAIEVNRDQFLRVWKDHAELSRVVDETQRQLDRRKAQRAGLTYSEPPSLVALAAPSKASLPPLPSRESLGDDSVEDQDERFRRQIAAATEYLLRLQESLDAIIQEIGRANDQIVEKQRKLLDLQKAIGELEKN